MSKSKPGGQNADESCGMNEPFLKIVILFLILALGAATAAMPLCQPATAPASGGDCLIKCAGSPAAQSATFALEAIILAVAWVLFLNRRAEPVRAANDARPAEWLSGPPHQPPRVSL